MIEEVIWIERTDQMIIGGIIIFIIGVSMGISIGMIIGVEKVQKIIFASLEKMANEKNV